MPKFFEVFGIRSTELTDISLLDIKTSVCPFTGSVCDGGGNRHQTKIALSETHVLRNLFDNTLLSVVPAVCSIDYGADQWVVCPRRLMGFKNPYPAIPATNHFLQEHEREVLKSVGLKTELEYGVWSEVYLQYEIDDTEIDYHFDFIVAPLLKDISLSEAKEKFKFNSSEVVDLVKAAKTGKNFVSNINGGMFKALPDLDSPIIIEVMTASTSGSNTAAGTNISSAFSQLLLGKDYQGPGINKRQVWGRMATQLFAKSALAEFWNGKTYWLVQDQLLKNIELTTKLKISDNSNQSGMINFISMKYKQLNSRKIEMELSQVSKIPAGISFNGSGTCSDILLPKVFPPKIWLLKSMLRRNLAAVVKI